jgi:hypothetical protein
MPVRSALQRCGTEPCDCPDKERKELEDLNAGNRAVSSVLSQVVVQRQPAGDVCTTKLIGDDDWKVKGDYYKDVAREILETGETQQVEFERGLFIVAQARAEQGIGDPKKNRYRVLNLTVSDAESKGAKRVSTNPEIFETTSGRKFQRLRTKEHDPACTKAGVTPDADGWCTVTSRFYVYDSIGDQTRHYLDEMTKGRPGVMDILQKKKGRETAGIKDFGTALGKYGSDPNYAPKLCANYNTVVQDMTAILEQAIKTKNECLTEAWKKLNDAWAGFNKAHKEHADAHAATLRDPDRITRAQEGIRRAEQLVKQREDEVKWLEEAIKKLQARRTGLVKEAACPPMQKAVAPPPTP